MVVMVVKIVSCIVRSYDFTIYIHVADLRSSEKYDSGKSRGIDIANRNLCGILEFRNLTVLAAPFVATHLAPAPLAVICMCIYVFIKFLGSYDPCYYLPIHDSCLSFRS